MQPEVVILTNVVVTARDDIGSTANPLSNRGLWVADSLAGGPNNGVYVYKGTVMADPDRAELVIGARVSIQGGVDEFDLAPMGQTVMGDKLTEVVDPTFTNVTAPTGPLPSPATTATVAILGAIGAAGEPWEGVLVKIGPVKVTNASVGGGKIELTDNTAAKIHIDDDSFKFPTGMAPALNACIEVTGVMSVAIFDDLRTINPRSLTDVNVLDANMCN